MREQYGSDTVHYSQRARVSIISVGGDSCVFPVSPSTGGHLSGALEVMLIFAPRKSLVALDIETVRQADIQISLAADVRSEQQSQTSSSRLETGQLRNQQPLERFAYGH